MSNVRKKRVLRIKRKKRIRKRFQAQLKDQECQYSDQQDMYMFR